MDKKLLMFVQTNFKQIFTESFQVSSRNEWFCKIQQKHTDYLKNV